MKNIYLNKELNNIPNITYEYLDGDPEKKYPALTRENITAVHNYVVNDSSYASEPSGDFVRKYFSEHKGDDLASVVTKVIMIDTVDSTNMKQLLGKSYYVIMAERIRENALEENIKAGAAIGDKFRKIAEVPIPPKKKKRKKNYNLFIFLSKYITRTNEYSYGGNAYSIMDSVVKRYLPLYRLHFLSHGNNELADQLTAKNLEKLHESFDFDGYCRLLGKIADDVGDISRVMLDHFLWFSFKTEAREDED